MLENGRVHILDGVRVPSRYVLGEVGGGRGLAIKIDDGSNRALHAAVVGIGERLGLFRPDEAKALAKWTQRTMTNRAGLEVGAIEVVG